MSSLFDTRDESQLLPGMRAARKALARGQLVVIPTDTVYGIAADAFDAAAVERLLDAKGRGRQAPPPVLVSGLETLRALVAELPEPIERLVHEFWPGGLTIVLPAQASLSWDLGETHGTVAVRMPAHPIALELLEESGPLAVSSANLTGVAAAVVAQDAKDMLGDAVEVYLDAGPAATGVASTIIDATGLVGGDGTQQVRVLRDGAIDRDRLREVLGDLLAADEPEIVDPDEAMAVPVSPAPSAGPIEPESEPAGDSPDAPAPAPVEEDSDPTPDGSPA